MGLRLSGAGQLHELARSCGRVWNGGGQGLTRDSSVVWVGQMGANIKEIFYFDTWREILFPPALCREVRVQDQRHSSTSGASGRYLVSCSRTLQQGRYMGLVRLSLRRAEAYATLLHSAIPKPLWFWEQMFWDKHCWNKNMHLLKLSKWFSFHENVVSGWTDRGASSCKHCNVWGSQEKWNREINKVVSLEKEKKRGW